MPPATLTRETQAELRRLLPSDAVAEVMTAVAEYRRIKRASAQHGDHTTRDLRRIRTKARALLAAIDAAEPWVQLGAHGYREVVAELERRSRRAANRPIDTRRRQLAHRIGLALHRHGVRLSGGKGGTLAKTLVAVIELVSNGRVVETDNVREICERVCDDVAEERRNTEQLRTAFARLRRG